MAIPTPGKALKIFLVVDIAAALVREVGAVFHDPGGLGSAGQGWQYDPDRGFLIRYAVFYKNFAAIRRQHISGRMEPFIFTYLNAIDGNGLFKDPLPCFLR